LVLRLIDELASNGAHSVSLSGGEPLLHPEIKKILKYAAPKIRIRLLTNGTLIDREWAAFLADMDISVQVSVDGSRREIHDVIRGEGNFEKSLRAIEHLQEAGLGKRINLSTTIMRQNFHDLKDVISLAESLKVPLVRFLPLRRAGSAKARWDSIGSQIGAKDHEQFYGYVSDLQIRQGSSVEITCGLAGFLLRVPEAFSADDTWCPVGRELIVDTNGDTYPCVLMMREMFKLGNVFHDGLTKIIQSHKMTLVCEALSERRMKIEKCASCLWRNLCQAGCMGLALDRKGTIWDTDDACDYRKMAYQEAFDKILARTRLD
jgi:uncharacterized protein